MQFQKRPESQARTRLAEALKERGAVEAKLAALSASSARLHQQVEAVGPAETALARHDAEHSARLATWSQGPEAEVPVADWERRAKLERELGAARATAASATAAKTGLEAQYVAEANKLPGVQSYASAATIEIIGETLPELIDEVVALQKQVANKVEMVVSAIDTSRDLMMRLAGPSRAVASTAFTVLAQRAAAVHDRHPAEPGFAMKARQAWQAFVEDLSQDSRVLFAPEAA
jgi:hypothetical protein